MNRRKRRPNRISIPALLAALFALLLLTLFLALFCFRPVLQKSPPTSAATGSLVLSQTEGTSSNPTGKSV